ncbi:uncharacterized protein DFL_008045 [Arthrobotrys flagrans]|uniref:Uncharacterized protein n=1 Tax=Arthrobotrys flagrans TaxID=97331 RepID=A0A436ZMN2_ARTFL|nr:hypothetical protein DFL_008045 [Arthrobotrys flagrans]
MHFLGNGQKSALQGIVKIYLILSFNAFPAFGTPQITRRPQYHPRGLRRCNELSARIWFSILEGLPTSDLKAFPLRSKYHREIALPLIFRHIRLSLAFIDGLEDSHITFTDLSASTLTSMVDLIRVYYEVLSVFPSLNSLTISFPCSKEIRSHLLAGIFHKSQLTHESSGELFSQTSSLEGNYHYSLSDATVNLTPPSLQKVAIIADLVGAYAPILQSSISTLKTLYVAAQAILTSYRHTPAGFAPGVILQTYPTVKDLWITFDGSTGVPAAGSFLSIFMIVSESTVTKG